MNILKSLNLINRLSGRLTQPPLQKILETMEENLEILDSVASGNSKFHTKTVDIASSEELTTISGSSFTPPITKEPVVIKAIMTVGGLQSEASIIAGYVANEGYYDIVVDQQESNLSSIKIKVLCES